MKVVNMAKKNKKISLAIGKNGENPFVMKW